MHYILGYNEDVSNGPCDFECELHAKNSCSNFIVPVGIISYKHILLHIYTNQNF